MEVKSMLATQFEAWKEQWLAEGKAEGKAEALICLLAEKRIRGARVVTLERWFKRAIVAPDLSSVFNQARRRMGCRQ